MMKLDHANEIVKHAFGMWIIALYGNIKGYNPGLTFSEHNEAFFALLKELLDKNKIRFCAEDDPLGKAGRFWVADSATIIKELRNQWPESARAENDIDVTLYFYKIPAVVWVAEDGSLHGS
jgi:hypothetical protein